MGQCPYTTGGVQTRVGGTILGQRVHARRGVEGGMALGAATDARVVHVLVLAMRH